MQGALTVTVAEGRVRWSPAPALPVAALMLGRPRTEAAALLPRLFNMCRHAQGMAARMALGLPPEDGGREDLAREVLRDHVLKLFVRWPQLLGMAPLALPRDWASNGEAMRAALVGAGLPTAAGFEDWLARDGGVAPVLRGISEGFAAGEAAVRLPLVTAKTALGAQAQENSVAGRQAEHPILKAIEAGRGRGPLWHGAARMVDALACLDGRLPEPVLLGDGTAVVPAARGLYAVRARAEGDIVTAFERRTPTDHLCAAGGGLDQALAGLQGVTAARVALLVDILDPCVPVVVREAADA